jgi:flavodoxin
MARSLIAYFSRKDENYVDGIITNLTVGNTEVAARIIQKLTGSDAFFIDPVIKYNADYYVCIEEAKRDLKTNARPEFINPLDTIDDYDTIYLGYPNYWGTMPLHVYTFLESYNFKGKTIRPFCTHEGGGMGLSEEDIKRTCSGAKVEKGLAIQGGIVNQLKRLIENCL